MARGEQLGSSFCDAVAGQNWASLAALVTVMCLQVNSGVCACAIYCGRSGCRQPLTTLHDTPPHVPHPTLSSWLQGGDFVIGSYMLPMSAISPLTQPCPAGYASTACPPSSLTRPSPAGCASTSCLLTSLTHPGPAGCAGRRLCDWQLHAPHERHLHAAQVRCLAGACRRLLH